MDRIREKLFETRALDEMDKNAISLLLSFKGKVNNGGTTATGPRYSKTSETWNISFEELSEIQNTDNLTEWVNNNYRSRKQRIFLDYKKCVKAKVYVNPTLYFKVSHYNKNRCWIKNRLKITTQRYYEPLVSKYFDEGEAYIQPTQKSPDIKPSSFDSDFDIIDSPPIKRRGSINSLVKEFLSKNTPWIDGEFGDFKSLDNKVKVPLIFENTIHNLEFRNPEDISSPLWELGSIFNYDDPWNICGEKFQITLNPL